MDSVFLSFSKAFSKFSKEKLLNKMIEYIIGSAFDISKNIIYFRHYVYSLLKKNERQQAVVASNLSRSSFV